MIKKKRGNPRRRSILNSAFETLEARWLFAVDVLGYHNDQQSTGVNANEVQITPGSISVNTFGKQFSVDVTDLPNLTGMPSSVLGAGINYTARSGQVYAQPLVKTGLNITTGAFQGVHDVVFVATMMNSLFAIDANGGTVLWKDSFIFNSGGNPNPVNANIASGVTAVPGGYGTETNSQDITPWMGILSTPVIDPVGGYIYLIANTREAQGNELLPHYVYRLHKIRMSDGFDTSSVIADTTFGLDAPGNPDYTYNVGPYTIGTGAGAINVGGQSRVYFNSVRQMERPGLVLSNGIIYSSWASHGDNSPYHGWVITFDANTLAITGALDTTPNSSEGEGGIWMGGGITALDPQGNFYVETGNGTFDGNYTVAANGTVTYTGLDANGFPINGDYGDTVMKLALDPTTTQGNQGTNKNGFGIKVVDYFAPYDAQLLDSSDEDLGSGGSMILPDSAGSAAHPHLMVSSGKEGKIYLIDRDNMGKFHNTDNVVQTIGGVLNGSLDTASYFNGRIYYTSGYGGTGISWQISNGVINTSSAQFTPDQYSFPGATTSISSNGLLNGIAWMIDKGTGQLRAYDASNLADEVWTSNMNATRDSLGATVKFTVPTPANGRVYVGADGKFFSFGPPQAPTSAPAAPTGLTATATGASTIQLNWTDNSNNEDGFKIERSSDGINFTEVATSGVNQASYVDSGLSAQAKYYYRVRAYNSFNTLSLSAYTNIANATTTASGTQTAVDVYHFDEGAGTTANDSVGTNTGTLAGAPLPAWVAGRVGNGALSFSGDGVYKQTLNESALNLTNDLSPILGGTSSIAFWIKTTQAGSSFYYQAPAVTGVEQDGGGNDIGWGWIDNTGHIGIYVGDTGWVLSNAPINNGAWHHVAISRNATNGAVSIYVDGVLNASGVLGTGLMTSQFKAIGELTVDNVDGVTKIGGNYFNGQLDDVQIYNQIITPQQVATLALAPTAPTNLTVTPASGTELDLAWTDNATTETGYKVERSISGGPFVQIVQLPPDSNSYMDIGLTQGTQYAYQVRATNTAGDSAYSNAVTVTTPTPPATPSNAVPTQITSTTITMTWQDNATDETAYRVLRRTGVAEFAVVAVLAPNTTSYLDNNKGAGLTPGVSYDYHIQAYNIAGYSDFTGFTATTLAVGTQAPADDYHFDEGSGTTAGDSTGTNPGTLVGATLPTWTTGIVGSGALSFSGDGTYDAQNESAVDMPTALSAILGGTSSMAFWIKTTQVGNNTFYMAPAITGVDQVGDENDIGWGWINGSGQIGIFVGNSGSLMTTKPVNDGTWHHIAMTRDATTGQVNIYLDGVLSDTNTFDPDTKSSIFRSIGELTVDNIDGVTKSGGNYFNGQLDEVQIYNRVISSDEVAALANVQSNPTAPAAPTNLTATAASSTSITLNWADNSSNETGFKIERSLNGGAFTQIFVTAANATTYTDIGLPAGNYTYQVRATNATGDSAYTNVSTSVTLPPPAAPAAPTTLAATAASSNSISLTWVDKSNNETGFKIERALNGGAFTQIFVTAVNATTYTDSGLAAGTYTYRVRATNTGGDSAYTNVSTGVTIAAATVPTAPSNLVATAASTSSITLAWSDNSTTETGYKIERSTNGTTFTQIFVTGANATTYTDPALAAGTYFYRVRATNAAGDSAYSNTSSTATLPAAPTTLALSVVSSSSIKLTWVDNATNETGYKIERSTDGTTFTQLSTIAAANSTTFTDTGLVAGTKYYYRVRATNAGGDSAYSNAPNATTTASTAIPSPWVQADVGTVGKAGSATYAAPTFTILGAGGDIWDKQDAFHYVYQPLSGDGTIIARVATEQNTNLYAKAGVMIRETLTAGSRSVTVDLTPNKLVEFLRRSTASAITTGTSNDVAAGAEWLKLARVGNVFTASRSTNGTTWTTVGSQTITMASGVFIGLIVCSHTTTALNTSTFDNVSVSGGVAAQGVVAAAQPLGALFNSTTKVTSDIASILV